MARYICRILLGNRSMEKRSPIHDHKYIRACFDDMPSGPVHRSSKQHESYGKPQPSIANHLTIIPVFSLTISASDSPPDYNASGSISGIQVTRESDARHLLGVQLRRWQLPGRIA